MISFFAGAIGIPQFMPTSIAHYAVDGDDDEHIDLASVPDAVMTVGSFLQKHGWQRGLLVFAPVALPADPSALVDGRPGTQARARPAAGWCPPRFGHRRRQLAGQPAGHIVDLAEETCGTANFFVITQYRSYFYVTAVADLVGTLQARAGLP